MEIDRQHARVGPGLTARLARLPTGAKLFLILSIALLPLALIAVFAALQTNRTTAHEAHKRLAVATAESARAMAVELSGDLNALRVTVDALETDPADAPSCARAQGVFVQQISAGARFEILDRAGRRICGSPLGKGLAGMVTGDGSITARLVQGRGLLLSVNSRDGSLVGTALFPKAFLLRIGQPSGLSVPFGARLLQDDDRLDLVPLGGFGPLDRLDQAQQPLGIDNVILEMETKASPITWAIGLAMLLPLMMWAAAAGIGWFVVDRLLIRPLRELRTRVAAYTPGEEIDPGEPSAMPAQEIRELGATFQAISRTVMLHEAGLAEGMVRQTKLTREVHHRVKNNLQVVSSLINLHSRATHSAEASAAYAAIQRRVDALAVVHRNHYAELEVNRGLSLRSVIGDLAANFRTTLAEPARLSIMLDLDSSLVSQDVATAVAFLITELVELAVTCQPETQLRISLRASANPGHATLRISAPGLADSDCLRTSLAQRYGRVVEGLSRQLRARLHHDPLVGAFEIDVPELGRD